MFVLIPLGALFLLWSIISFVYWEWSWGTDPFTQFWRETLQWFADKYPQSLLVLAALVPLVWLLDTFRWRLLKVLVPLSVLMLSGYGLERYWLSQRAWTGIVDGRWQVIARGWQIVWHCWPLLLSGALLGVGLVYTFMVLRPSEKGLPRWRRRWSGHPQVSNPPSAGIDAETLRRACQRAYQQGLAQGRQQSQNPVRSDKQCFGHRRSRRCANPVLRRHDLALWLLKTSAGHL